MDYSVPALDKALDVLELLAGNAGGLSPVAISAEVGRTVSQLFRVLHTLEARGYVVRDPLSGLYTLSLALFVLAHRQDPVRGLVAAAIGPMRALAESVQQSCNLGMLDAGRILIVAQVESPAPFGFRVRVGAEFAVESTATGAVLTAFAEGAAASEIRERGFERRNDHLQPGITDIVFPVFGLGGKTVAALTVPYVATSFSGSGAGVVEREARAAASAISGALGQQ